MLTSGKAKTRGSLTVEKPKPEMVSIPFTQYSQPDGEPMGNSIDMDPETSKRALWVINRGYRFTVEVLTTGEVSMTCETKSEPGPMKEREVVSVALCNNGPQVVEAVRDLVNRAWDALGGSHGN